MRISASLRLAGIAWFVFALWIGIIFYASSLPGESIPRLFLFQDTVFHVCVYAALGYVFITAVGYTWPATSRIWLLLLAGVCGAVLGIFDEWHQAYVSGRSVSGLDVFWDSVGSLFGGLLYRWQK